MTTAVFARKDAAALAAHAALLETPGAPPWFQLLRKHALVSFGKLGLPTTREEDWRYTNVQPLSAVGFALPPADGHDALRVRTSAAEAFDRLGTLGPSLVRSRLVFVNGRFDRDWSRMDETPTGVRLAPLADVLTTEPQLLEPHLGKRANVERHAFVALNTAYLADAAILHVPRGLVLAEPIHVLHLSAPASGPVMSHPRTLVVLEEGAQASVVEVFAGKGGSPALVNAVTEASLAPGSALVHHTLQAQDLDANHIMSLHAHLDRDSAIVSRVISLGARVARNEIHVDLDGEGSSARLEGLYGATGEQHVDNHTVLQHRKPHTSSQELYKGLLAGKARGIFDGTIVVHPNAQKTDARQTNRNLILSETALADSKPQLEIYNNDVKCSHGSTTGRLDPAALFYLRSRGLSLAAAQDLLTYAFASELIDPLTVPELKHWAAETLHSWLGSGGTDPDPEVE